MNMQFISGVKMAKWGEIDVHVHANIHIHLINKDNAKLRYQSPWSNVPGSCNGSYALIGRNKKLMILPVS